MRLRNKVLAAALATAMIVPVGGANVFAATTTGTTEDTTATTNVKYSVTQGYEWSIHSDIDFGNDAGVQTTVEKTTDKDGKTNTVSVGKNIIPDGKKLNITVKGSGTNGAFEIANGKTKLNYTIKNGADNIATGETVLDVAAGTNTGSKDLTFTLTTTDKTAEVAGDYAGTVTYTASIK